MACFRAGSPGFREVGLEQRPAGLDSSRSSADLLGERDDEDARTATHITEPIAVLVLHQLANQFGTVGDQYQ